MARRENVAARGGHTGRAVAGTMTGGESLASMTDAVPAESRGAPVAEQASEPERRTFTIHGVPDSIPVTFRKATPPAEAGYTGRHPGLQVLPAGTIVREGRRPLPVDVLEDQDVAIGLRDGTLIYADVFRPVDDRPAPAILVWGPYGKRGGSLSNDLFPGRMDVPADWEDGLNKFEGANPGYWVDHGYAVVNVDPRGVYGSEGDIQFFGQQDAVDEYDVIEWIAEQPWCSGKVALTGNSWLAITQWNVAALQPPHLAAIAPWEGLSDPYRDSTARGGIPDTVFTELITSGFAGEGWAEDLAEMIRSHPLVDEYWLSKVPDFSAITVPAYVVSAWTNLLHTRGTLDGWERIASPEKWLRVHNTHEWNDFYNPVHVEDLRRFLDHVLKGVDNGWEATPAVRLSVLDPGHTDIVGRPELAFPLERQQLTRFWLDTVGGRLVENTLNDPAPLAYEPDAEGIVFRHTFTRDTEIVGYGAAKLWMAVEDADDLDVYVYLSKIAPDGTELLPQVVTERVHAGMNGRLRASRRRTDPARSTPERPFQTFAEEEKLGPGEIVPLEIPLWPYGFRFHRGETLQVRINGADLLVRPEFPDLPTSPNINGGRHILYAGGEYDSHLLLPIIADD